jgi:hypothetical protein
MLGLPFDWGIDFLRLVRKQLGACLGDQPWRYRRVRGGATARRIRGDGIRDARFTAAGGVPSKEIIVAV